jgi:tetratricopeptide (TPR) repeat protein
LTLFVRDKVRTAQVDESRAEVFIAEQKYAQAEATARIAAKSFEKAGRQCFLADALTTQGVALARLGQTERAQFIFQKAIEVAHQAGALHAAGLAALSLIEEIDRLPTEVVIAAYEQARDWLADSQNKSVLRRLKAARKKLPSQLGGKPESQDTVELLFNKQRYLPDEVLKFERSLISQALAKAEGRVTHAA